LTIEPKQFARQVRWLVKNGYTGIRASDWLARKQHGTPLPKKPVLLTFDDAYADTFEYALPILAQYNFSATVFVVSAMVGQRDAWNESEVSKSVLKLATREQILAWSLRGMEMGGHGQVRFSRFDGRTPNAIALS
jgi:peptidoglycan/xylan/chitin deacetylase (PgdA/CDA1 family)